MLLKKTAKQRRRKAELIKVRREQEEERQHISNLIHAEAVLTSKHYRMEDAITTLDQNEKMLQYLKEKGVMDEDGRMKV